MARTSLLKETRERRKERLPFSYPDVIKGKRVEENIALKPGDTVIVP